MMSLSLSSIIGSTVEYLPAYDIFASAASEDMIMQYHTITQEQFEEFQYYYIFDVLKGYRYGEAFCRKFNISYVSPLYYFKSQSVCDRWIRDNYLVKE